jgi:hypothetical protein
MMGWHRRAGLPVLDVHCEELRMPDDVPPDLGGYQLERRCRAGNAAVFSLCNARGQLFGPVILNGFQTTRLSSLGRGSLAIHSCAPRDLNGAFDAPPIHPASVRAGSRSHALRNATVS